MLFLRIHSELSSPTAIILFIYFAKYAYMFGMFLVIGDHAELSHQRLQRLQGQGGILREWRQPHLLLDLYGILASEEAAAALIAELLRALFSGAPASGVEQFRFSHRENLQHLQVLALPLPPSLPIALALALALPPPRALSLCLTLSLSLPFFLCARV